MSRLILSTVMLGLAAPVLRADGRSEDPKRNWGQWRGPAANGVAYDANPPTEWSEEKNIRWKAPIPGHGHSTPIVWGDFVYLQTAIPTVEKTAVREDATSEGDRERGREGRRGRGSRGEAPTDAYKFTILALDRRTGKTAWQRTLREQVPHEGTHQDGSLAPASPTTDGEVLIAFLGSRGVYGLSMSGDVLWEKDLGQMRTRNSFGEGSSPVIFGDTVIVNWDHEGDSFIVALDKKTGKEKWRKDRNEVTSWSTPLILDEGERTHVVVSATDRVRSYCLKTGETLWECGGLGLNCIPAPVAADGMVYVMSGFRDDALLAIKYRGASGDLTGSGAVTWKLDRGTPYVPSPLLYGNTLYFLQKNTGILSNYEPKGGEPHFTQQRLEEITGVYASPVGASDRVYVVGRNGATYVLRRGPEFKVPSVNTLDDEFSASPAIVGDELFLRGHKNLYCIAGK